jgi:hypothetical protein
VVNELLENVMQEPWYYTSDEDKAAVADARRLNIVIPRYRMTATTHDGQPYCCEAEFRPIQFRNITGAPFPECCTPRNCAWLIDLWNKGGAAHGYHYEQV